MSLLLLLLHTCLHAQVQHDYVVTTRHLTTDDGMATEVLTCGLQDKLGFIWLGTTEGLQRYDGARFRLFTNKKNGLQSDYINHMALAADGVIWITYGTVDVKGGGSVDLLEPGTDTVVSFNRAFGSKAPFDERQIFLVLANEYGDIFILTLSSDVWMYRQGKFRKVYDHPVELLFTRLTWHHKAKGGHLWLSTADGRSIHTDTAGRWTVINVQGSSSTFPLSVSSDGSALLYSDFDFPNEPLVKPRLTVASPGGQMAPAVFDPYKNVNARSYEGYYLDVHWDVLSGALGYQSNSAGICLLLPDQHTVIQVIDSMEMTSLNNVLLSDVFSDASGRYWLCTARGVFIVDVRLNSFRHFLDKKELRTTVAQARGICQINEGSTMAAVWDGFYEFRDSDGSIIRHIPGKNATVLYRDGTHTWAATRDSLIDITGGTRSCALKDRLGNDNEIWALYNDGNRFYAGTTHGIWEINGAAAQWRRISGNGDGTDGWCYGFFPARDGALWTATTNGVLRIKDGKITGRYAPDAPEASHRIPSKDVHYIYEEADGALWLCTNGDGLVHWQPQKNVTTKYMVADGLSSNTIYALLPDDNGHFWLSSSKGLMRFDPRTGGVRIYTVRDGLPDDEFNRLSSFKARNGRMYFGGINGLVSFDPNELTNPHVAAYQPPLRVSSLSMYSDADNRVVDKTADLLRTNTIAIKPEDGVYTLDFQLLDFDRKSHVYAYKIEGLEQQWNYITESSLRLGNLPYGDYILRVKGKQDAGGWSSSELAIKLQVLRPFYMQPWFLLIVILAITAAVLLGIRWRERRLRQANEHLEKIIAQRTGQLGQMLNEKDLLMKEIHHRVKNNLQVISSLQQMQASRSHDPAVKAALSDSQNRVLSIAFIHQNLYQHDDLKGVEMQSFVRELTNHVLTVCMDREKNVDIQQEVSPVTLDIDTAVPVGLILNELLTNSCKHAFCDRLQGRISIRLRQDGPGCYVMEYEDDGPGLDKKFDMEKSNSLGMRLIYQLADQLEGTLRYTNATVSRFDLTFKDYETRNND